MTIKSLPRIGAAALRERLLEPGEHALLDIREEGVFAHGHILLATNAPFSRFERLVPSLVPRRGTPIVLVDDDDGLAEQAARTFTQSGYRSIALLDGGNRAWGEAGFELFSGVFVPSKAFGEFVEHDCRTPHIEAREFERRRAAGEDLVLLDSRPFDEYSWITIPGAVNCPGAELVWRARETVSSERTLVVVNCGGRTRSIIGAQSLIDAGLPNPVLSLKDGTQGWHLAGLAVQRGAENVAPQPDARTRAWAREAAERLAQRFDLLPIDEETLARFEREADERTLYRFDVRDLDEFRGGHRPGFLSAPGGQLVQATDTFIAVREARIVLADKGEGVRARTTATWLRRMGLPNIYVLDEPDPVLSETGEPTAGMLKVEGTEPAALSPDELAERLLDHSAVVVDVATSRQYRAGHVPGAIFALRGRLREDARNLPAADAYVATSLDGALARLAVAELAEATGRPVFALEGGTAAWVASGRPLETDRERLASRDDDVFLKAFERRQNQEGAMRDYLRWEVDLVEAVRRDGTLRFALEPAPVLESDGHE